MVYVQCCYIWITHSQNHAVCYLFYLFFYFFVIIDVLVVPSLESSTLIGFYEITNVRGEVIKGKQR